MSNLPHLKLTEEIKAHFKEILERNGVMIEFSEDWTSTEDILKAASIPQERELIESTIFGCADALQKIKDDPEKYGTTLESCYQEIKKDMQKRAAQIIQKRLNNPGAGTSKPGDGGESNIDGGDIPPGRGGGGGPKGWSR